jgi:hypothetical protein
MLRQGPLFDPTDGDHFMIKRNSQILSVWFVLCDLVSTGTAWVGAYYLRFGSGWIPIHYGAFAKKWSERSRERFLCPCS